MYLKTKTITAALIFLPFLSLEEHSALACCLGFPLNAFLTQIRAHQQPLHLPPSTTSSVGGVSSAQRLVYQAHQVLVCNLYSAKGYK